MGGRQQCILHHRRNRAGNHAVGIDAHFSDVIRCLELRLLQILRTEGVGVDDDSGVGLGVAQLRLEGSGVHGHEHVALVTRRIDLAGTDVHLET